MLRDSRLLDAIRATIGRIRGDCNLNGVTLETGETPVTVVAVDVSAEPVEASDEQLVRQLVDRARAEGLKLTGEGVCWPG